MPLPSGGGTKQYSSPGKPLFKWQGSGSLAHGVVHEGRRSLHASGNRFSLEALGDAALPFESASRDGTAAGAPAASRASALVSLPLAAVGLSDAALAAESCAADFEPSDGAALGGAASLEALSSPESPHAQ